MNIFEATVLNKDLLNTFDKKHYPTRYEAFQTALKALELVPELVEVLKKMLRTLQVQYKMGIGGRGEIDMLKQALSKAERINNV